MPSPWADYSPCYHFLYSKSLFFCVFFPWITESCVLTHGLPCVPERLIWPPTGITVPFSTLGKQLCKMQSDLLKATDNELCPKQTFTYSCFSFKASLSQILRENENFTWHIWKIVNSIVYIWKIVNSVVYLVINTLCFWHVLAVVPVKLGFQFSSDIILVQNLIPLCEIRQENLS